MLIDKLSLEKIPWETLDTAHGKAGHVPKALEGLTSPDENVRYKSYWQLDNNVVLQGDLYEAAYYVAPFLMQMLRDNVLYGKEKIYDLLCEIAFGYAVPTTFVLTFEGNKVPLTEACVLEVKKGIDIYISDCNNTDEKIKMRAEDLIEFFFEDKLSNRKNS